MALNGWAELQNLESPTKILRVSRPAFLTYIHTYIHTYQSQCCKYWFDWWKIDQTKSLNWPKQCPVTYCYYKHSRLVGSQVNLRIILACGFVKTQVQPNLFLIARTGWGTTHSWRKFFFFLRGGPVRYVHHLLFHVHDAVGTHRLWRHR